MKSLNRSEFIATGLLAAAIAVCFLPIPGQTQDSKTDPTLPTRRNSSDQLEGDQRSLPVGLPDAGDPGADPLTTSRKFGFRFPEESGELADKIRKEVEESVMREMKADATLKSKILRDRIDKEVAERLEGIAVQRALDARKHSAEFTLRSVSPDARPPHLDIRVVESRRGAIFDRGRVKALSDQHLERTTRELLSSYGNYSDDNRNEFVAKLTKVVSEHFEVKQSLREQELKQLEGQLATLKSLHTQRMKEKGQIIQDRVRQLTRDAAGLGWGGDRHDAEMSDDDGDSVIIERLDEVEHDDGGPETR